MNGRLRVMLDPGSAPHGQALACEVTGGGDRYTAMLGWKRTFELDLPPGTYVVRVILPSGSLLAAVATVHVGQATQISLTPEVTRPPAASPGSTVERTSGPLSQRATDNGFVGAESSPIRPWDDLAVVEAWRPDVLADAPLRKEVVVPPGFEQDAYGPDRVPLDPPLLPRRRVWVRLWLGSQTASWKDPVSVSDEGSIAVQMSTAVGPYAIQVGGPEVAWRIVCMPPAFGARLLVVSSIDPMGFDDGVHVSVTGRSPLAAAMLNYLASGQIDAAKVVGPELVDQAERLFQERRASPESAAAAGYFLLRVGKLETIGEWPEVFADRFGWLPDAQVIYAAQLLRRTGAPNRDVARERLLDAVDEGVPRYTEGLRVLVESLQALAGQDPSDQAVTHALTEVRRYAAACDWNAIYTTYWAVRPAEPTLERHSGWPLDPSGWVELPSAQNGGSNR